MKCIKLLFLAALTFVVACSLEPKYQKPESQIKLPKIAQQNSNWREFFLNKELQDLIDLAIANNKDLKNAILSVEIAEQAYNVKRADLLPNINAFGNMTKQKLNTKLSPFAIKKSYRAGLDLSLYEIDFFGRVRSLKNVEKNKYLASEESKNLVYLSLISQVSNAYIQLALDREILSLSKEEQKKWQEKLEIIKRRNSNGRATSSDVIEAEIDLENSNIGVSVAEKLLEQDVNLLLLLVGSSDVKLIPNLPLGEIKINEKLLFDVPSQSLLQRPDIKYAEYNLISANANIGAARAAFFPSISITGSYGYGSQKFNDLWTSNMWSFTPQVNLPIFSGGRNLAALKIANLEKEARINDYQRAIEQAFKEVKDGLASKQAADLQLKNQQNIYQMRQKSYQISQKKHSLGASDLTSVVDSKINLIQANQDFLAKRKEHLASLVMLYKVFGLGL